MLLDTIRLHVTESVKKHDSERSETLRYLLAAVQNFVISKYGADAQSKTTDQDVLEVLRKQVKSHKESIVAFTTGSRLDLVEKENQQLVLLESYLPSQLSDAEIKKLLIPVIGSGEKNFGLLMKDAMGILKGKADGSRVSVLLKTMIDEPNK